MKDLSAEKNLRSKTLELEAVMFKMHDDHVELPLNHHFAPGLYARELFIPKDVTLVGKLHKTEHLLVLTQGDVSILGKEGADRFIAPHTFVTKPGTKRVIYAHEDSVLMTFHVTEETDPEKVEAAIIAPDFEALGALDPLKLLEDK